MKNCVFLVDGFNLYHAIDQHPPFRGYKWLDLKALANAYIQKHDEQLIEVVYFTALPVWNPQKSERHQRLISAYQDQGIKIVRGLFKKTTYTCRGTCQQQYQTYVEKMTDLNICIEMLKRGAEPNIDKILLVTADNDQTSAINRFKQLYPNKIVKVIIPPFRHAEELKNAAHQYAAISKIQLEKSQLPNPLKLKNGRTISKPENWTAGPAPINPSNAYSNYDSEITHGIGK